MLRAREISTILGVHIRTVYRLIETGELKSYKFGPKSFRVHPEDLDEFIKTKYTGEV